MQEIIDKILDWPVIIQGVLGSAIFWIIERLITLLAKFVSSRYKGSLFFTQRETKIREWIYRKYYSRSGLVNIVQGFVVTLDHVFRYLIRGLIFIVLGVFFSQFSQIALSISLTATFYYLIRSLIWLTPDSSWTDSDLLKHWKRIGVLEKELFGHTNEDTKKNIRFHSEIKDANEKDESEE